MTEHPIPYETWIDEALRGVIRRALERAATDGLPGDHHFYVTFRTDVDGTMVNPRLKNHHPEQMTIVLQHQFWDLELEDDAFAVTLKFRGKPERLRIPFRAVTQFADPAVNFGLQFKVPPLQDEDMPEESAPQDRTRDGEPADAFRADGVPDHESTAAETSVPGDGDPVTGDPKESKDSGQIIVLDSFRKT